MPAKPLRPFLAGALALACLAAPEARADESNFRPYLVGSRAAGMGGAFTALADDGSGPWYNPGGLAFVQRSQLSIAGSVYGLATGSFENALGDGHDFKYSSLNTFPTATAAVWKSGDPGATDANVFSLGVFIPDAVNIDDRDTIVSKQNAFFFTDQVQTVWAGLSYARRMGRLGVGATGFLLFGTRISQTDITVVNPANPAVFATLGGRTDESVIGFAGAVGARWDVTDDLRVGLSVYSPALGGGKRRLFAKATQGAVGTGPAAVVVNVDDLHASLSQPLRAQAGVALVSGPLTLAADLVYLAPRETWDDKGRAAEGLDKRIKRNGVLNGSFGLEYVAADRYPVRAGLFTDLSASPAPVGYSTAGTDPNPYNTSHVNRFGGTFSVGVRTDHTATDLGVMLSAGTGTDLVPDNLDFSNYKSTNSSQALVYLFLGTSYEF